MNTQDWNDIGRLVGVCLAICRVIDDEPRAEIVEALRSAHPNNAPNVRRVFWCLADTLDPIPLQDDPDEVRRLWPKSF